MWRKIYPTNCVCGEKKDKYHVWLLTDTINTNWHINNCIPCEFASIPKASKYFHQRPSRLLFTPTIRIYSSVLLLSINSSIWLSSNPAILTTATSMIFWYAQVLEMTIVILRCLRWPGAISLLRIPQSGARTGNRSSGIWFLLSLLFCCLSKLIENYVLPIWL